MGADLRKGDRVFAIVDGVRCTGDLGTIVEVVRTKTGTRVAVIQWDTGEVDQVTPHGRPDGSCGEIGAQLVGGR
jgi:hypothetical protein